MGNNSQCIFKFLPYSIDTHVQWNNKIDINWHELNRFANEQAIVGVLLEGIKQFSKKGIKPPFDILMEWIATSEQIKGLNELLNKRCVEVVKEYNNAGFQCCVLKGQGNAMMYPNPYSRTPGDIDLWVIPADGRCKRNVIRRSVTQYVKEKHPENLEVRYYHVGYQDKGIEVEVHFMPNIMNNPIYHHRLQRWYHKMADGGRLKEEVELPEGMGAIPVPTVEINIVFQLAHMMHHFFDEGIGLRQMIDYYYVLIKFKDESLEFRDSPKSIELEKTLKYLGLWKFAGAVMYIMKEVLGLEDKYLIVPVDESRGKTLLNEIVKGGNFGHYSGLEQHNAAKKYFQKTWRNMKLVKEYPAEALCEPVFRTWHFFWRLSHR